MDWPPDVGIGGRESKTPALTAGTPFPAVRAGITSATTDQAEGAVRLTAYYRSG